MTSFGPGQTHFKHAVVMATSNKHKLAEMKELLSQLPMILLCPEDVLGEPVYVAEDADSFEGNASKKAREIGMKTMMLTLADDSGLEVDALDGRPGVFSSRFAGNNATDGENNAALLSALHELSSLGDPSRHLLNKCMIAPDGTLMYNARFRCVLAFYDPFDELSSPYLTSGSCEGYISSEAKGSLGFGYDPLFHLAGDPRSFAQLSYEEKNRVSHREKACREMIRYLGVFLSDREQNLSRLSKISFPPMAR